jgi:ATP-dependent Lhr-like helicase
MPLAEGRHLLLAATDPAQPYGAQLPWPKPILRALDDSEERRGGRRPSRVAGAYVMLRDGEPVIYVERGGKGILRLARLGADELAAALGALTDATAAGVVPRLRIERVDGEPVIGSELEPALAEAGFSRQPKRMVASA